jgi:hypothetical protein
VINIPEGRKIVIRPVSKLKEKFKKRVEAAGPDYEFGVKNPLRTWLEEFTAVAETIKEALKQMAEEERFKHGAERVGQKKWLDNTGRKGPARWREETPKRSDEWEKEWTPFKDEIEKVVLEMKKPRGDPANIDKRVKPIVDALVRKRKELRGVKTS